MLRKRHGANDFEDIPRPDAFTSPGLASEWDARHRLTRAVHEAVAAQEQVIASIQARSPEAVPLIETILSSPKTIAIESLVNPLLLHAAVLSDHHDVIKYLVCTHGVVTVKAHPQGAEVHIAEEVIALRKFELLTFMASIGCSLNTMLHHGWTSVFVAVQDECGTDGASEILSEFVECEKSRIADPERLNGILLTVRSV
jgi:hypothetical protein